MPAVADIQNLVKFIEKESDKLFAKQQQEAEQTSRSLLQAANAFNNAILQNRQQSATNQRQLQRLGIQAAQAGFQLRPDGFGGVTAVATSEREARQERAEEIQELELEGARAEARQRQISEQAPELARRLELQEQFAGPPPAGGFVGELEPLSPRERATANLFRQKQRSIEADISIKEAKAAKEGGMFQVPTDPEVQGFLEKAAESITPDDLVQLGVRPEQLQTAASDYISTARSEGAPPTVEGFRQFLVKRLTQNQLLDKLGEKGEVDAAIDAALKLDIEENQLNPALRIFDLEDANDAISIGAFSNLRDAINNVAENFGARTEASKKGALIALGSSLRLKLAQFLRSKDISIVRDGDKLTILPTVRFGPFSRKKLPAGSVEDFNVLVRTIDGEPSIPPEELQALNEILNTFKELDIEFESLISDRATTVEQLKKGGIKREAVPQSERARSERFLRDIDISLLGVQS